MKEYRHNPKSSKGPLEGWKIIDMSRVLGGPYCTQLLGDLGASVIKLEPPQGDETRDWGPPFNEGESAYFQGINRNKKSISIDLSKEPGKQILFELLKDSDAVVENFKPGTTERWGIDYDTIKEIFPKIIYCRVSGFGEDGPLGGFPGYDALLQAMCGWFSVNGEPENDGVRMGIPLVDIATGLLASNAILSAAIERSKSGKGQLAEVSLFDTGVALQHPHAPNWFMSKKLPERVGNAHTNISPYDSYPTKTIPIYLSIGNNNQFQKFCSEIGEPELAKNPKYINNSNRVINKKELREVLINIFSNFDGQSLAEKLLSIGVPAGPILNIEGILNHPHTKHRDMIVQIQEYKGLGIPIKYNRTPGTIRLKPPKFGENNIEILTKLGYTEEQIKNLIKEKIILTSRKKES